jgi:uroporphyrinogen decarboxylase
MSLMATAKGIKARPRSPRVQRNSRAVAPALTSRQRFINACNCRPVDRPPIWMMRQAGRCLPEYRALKEKYSFLELVRTPELAAEVTLQPIRRFGFDAAILFSDILVVPEAMGQGYHFRDAGGVQMDFRIRTRSDVQRLSPDAIAGNLHYAVQALELLKTALKSRTALIGFAGSPWTLANFMLEGGSAPKFTRALKLFQNDRPLFDLLMEKLSAAVARFLELQIAAGADAVQVFDTLGGLIPKNDFADASGQWIKRIVSALDQRAPVIVFSKGTRDWETLIDLGAQVLGVDDRMDLAEARKLFPGDMAIQGNLDPSLLTCLSPGELSLKTRQMLEKMRGRPGYIVNLGHGVPPDAPLENIAAVVETVRKFR